MALLSASMIRREYTCLIPSHQVVSDRNSFRASCSAHFSIPFLILLHPISSIFPYLPDEVPPLNDPVHHLSGLQVTCKR